MNMIKELNKWEDIPCSWIRRPKNVKIQFFPTCSIDSTQFQSKSQLVILLLWTNSFWSLYRSKRLRIVNTYQRKSRKRTDTTLFSLLKSYSDQDSVVLVKNNRQINQWNRIESPDIDSHKYTQLNFDKGSNVTQ